MSGPIGHHLCIVDGLSSGNLLAPVARDLGFSPVHIQSSTQIIPELESTFHPGDYDLQLTHYGDPHGISKDSRSLHNLYERVSRSCSPAAFIAGTETGVILAAHLSEMAKLPGNPSSLSLACRDKLKMLKRLREENIPVANFTGATSAEEIFDWMSREKVDFPIFLKPLTGAATVGVRKCSGKGEVRKHFAAIYGKPNLFGIVDSMILAMAFMDGPEYVVNTVSAAGRHIVSGIWKYGEKIVRSGAAVYNYDEILAGTGKSQDRLVEYAFKVLNAFGIKYGPAHMEIKFTSNGPMLVEVGARLMGGNGLPLLEANATGRDAVLLSILSFIDPESLNNISSQYGVLEKHALCVDLTTQKPGAQMSYENLHGARNLQSYFRHSLLPQGTRLQKTVDLETSPGSVWLLSRDPQTVHTDYLSIRALEKSGAFEEAADLRTKLMNYWSAWMASIKMDPRERNLLMRAVGPY